MKRFHYALKTVVMMVAIFTASFASAQLQRYPDPGPAKPSAEQIAQQQTRENFFRFVKELQAHNPATQLNAADAPALTPLRQRPEKILRTPWDPEGNIYATVPNFMGITSYGDAYYGKFDVLSGTISRIWRSATLTNNDEAYLQSGFIRDNILYIPQMVYDEIGMVTHEAKIIWKRFDISTGRTLTALDFGSDADAFTMFTYGMTYDPIHDVVYGLSYDNVSGVGGGLMMVDCSKPVEEWVGVPLFNVGGAVNDWMAGICYNPEDDTLYGLKTQGVLCEIDLQRKGVVTLNEYDDFMEDFCFPPAMQSNAMCYSPHDKAILFVFGSTSGYFSICSIDTETYEAVELAPISPLAMVGNLYCADQYAKDDAPALMDAPVLNFKNAETKGTYSFTAPLTYYNGIKLDKDVVMHILVDDVEIYSATVAPGQTVTNEIELPEGLHFIKGYCSLDDLNGPVASQRIYIGNDQPYAPTGLSYIGGVLTWKTPVATGVNNAYLDLSNVTYDVYVDGVKHNSEPIKGNSYAMTFNEPADGRKAITVTATANGQTSDHSQALSRVLGQGYSLPKTIAPTAGEASLFEKLNVNNDAYEWTYYSASATEPANWMIHTQEYTEKPNDWLFLPPMYFDNAQDVYNLIVTYANARRNNIQKDNTEIWIGKDPVPSAMTKMIYSHEGRIQPVETDLEVSFAVPEAGTYFIGFYAKPGNENLYRGISLRNFRISKSKNSSTAAPGELTEVVLTPAEYGELFVTVEATIPTVDMTGNPLPADQDVTLIIHTEASASNPSVLTGKPGDKVQTLLAVDVDGFSDVFITPSNENGSGSRQVFTTYTGYDNPLPPTLTGIHISEDNLSLTVSWEAVGNVGQHGGYVDPNEVTYDIYTQSTAGSSKIGTAGKELSYTYTVGNIPQNYYYFGPVATNEIGISTNGQFVSETLGRPYNTPILEEWGYSAFTLQKWMTNTVAPYKSVKWEHMTEPSELSGSGITFGQGGALRAVSESAGKNWGELLSPRVSTINDPKVGVTLRYWNNPAAGHMELWGRSYGNQEYRKIAELEPSRPAEGQWEDWEVSLPADFCEQPWVQINVRAFISSNQNVIIDSYKVQQQIENDFQLTTLTGPYSVFVGEDATFDITVTNNGTENGRGKLTVELEGDNTILETKVFDIERIRSGEEFITTASFKILENYITDYDFLTVYATAEAEGDQNARNNSKYYEVLYYDSPMPIVRDLAASRDEKGDVNLTWSLPDNKEKGLESGELYPAFTLDENFGPWTVADIDGKEPFSINNRRWQGDDQPAGWVIWDAKEMKSKDEPRLCPRSGDKAFLARSVAYESSTDKPTRAMDFLISPEVKGGSKVNFWMNTLDSQYTETIAIFYSTTDTTLNPDDVELDNKDTAPRQCGSFKWLCNFTKSGSETWEQLEFTLPEDAKYFAFVYSSFGMFGAMIDDIVYTPVNPVMIDVDSYDVLVAYPGEEPKTVMQEIKANAFTHASTDGREATYYVKTNVISGDNILKSPLSNPAKVVANGIEGLEAGQYVSAGKGKIVIGGAAGKNVTICDAAGRVLSKATISNDPQSFAMEAGIYLVKLGDATVKVMVK